MSLFVSVLWLAFGLLSVTSSSAPITPTNRNLRLIRWSNDPKTTAYIPLNALDYLRNQQDQIDASSQILDGVPRAFVDHMIHRRRRGPGFLDLTEVGTSNAEDTKTFQAPTFHSPEASLHPEVEAMFRDVSPRDLHDIVEFLSTNFSTRHYLSTNARAPSLWIRDQFVAATSDAANVRLFNHTWDQPSGKLVKDEGSLRLAYVVLCQ
jgi:hypothetical protein